MAGPLFRFGLVTDVQHADKETVSFEGRPQRYRESAGKLKAALADLGQQQRPGAATSQQADTQQQPLSFVLTLGDIIDGYSGAADASTAAARASSELQEIAQLFNSALTVPVYHVLGNHCLAANRSELLEVLHMPNSFYEVQLGHGWRLIVLDTTEMSLHSGYPEDSPQMQQAREWLQCHPKDQHPNAEPWNGGPAERQMAWLRQELTSAAAAGDKVIVACHHPLAPGSAPDQYLAWDHESIRQLLEDSHPGTVQLVLCGHYHPGGYAEHNGVHYVVFEGILEAPPDSNAYGVVEVWLGKIVIRGYGVGTTRELLLS